MTRVQNCFAMGGRGRPAKRPRRALDEKIRSCCSACSNGLGWIDPDWLHASGSQRSTCAPACQTQQSCALACPRHSDSPRLVERRACKAHSELCGGYSKSASLVSFWAQPERNSPAGAKSRPRNHAKQRNLRQTANQAKSAPHALCKPTSSYQIQRTYTTPSPPAMGKQGHDQA